MKVETDGVRKNIALEEMKISVGEQRRRRKKKRVCIGKHKIFYISGGFLLLWFRLISGTYLNKAFSSNSVSPFRLVAEVTKVG